MEISKGLKKLANGFAKQDFHLYIVGGFVRDILLGLNPKDIDIASNMPIDKVMEICSTLKFDCKIINKTLGTLQIKNSKECFEYTRFRTESYTSGHSPSSVKFVDDLSIDALRRDLTINSIYYDITSNQIIDPLGGLKDLNKHRICTSNQPDITLRDDGLRILRVIRFASTYNFKIQRDTAKALKCFRTNLKSISKERILNELKLLTVADLKFENPNTIFWDSLNKLELLPLIFNHSLHTIKKLSKKDKNIFYKLPENLRLTGFYLTVLKNFGKHYMKPAHLKFSINTLFGLEGIRESSEIIRLLEKLYLIYQNIEHDVDTLNASINYLGLADDSRMLIHMYLSEQAKERLDSNIKLVRGKNLPLSVHDLDVTAQDLIDARIDKRYIGQILSTLYNQVIEMKIPNKNIALINTAKNINQTFLDIIKNKRSN